MSYRDIEKDIECFPPLIFVLILLVLFPTKLIVVWLNELAFNRLQTNRLLLLSFGILLRKKYIFHAS